MPRNILRLVWDEQTVIRLDQGPEGKEHHGANGTDWQYILNHDQDIMWLPREGRDALLQSGAKAGDSVRLTKMRRGSRTIFAANKAAPAPASSPALETTKELPMEPAGTRYPGSEIVADCFYKAIDASMLATQYAKEHHGLPLQFDAEQIRRLAITLMIGAQREQGL